MSELKRIAHEAIPRAVQKAERYRLLNEPWATESICLDILEVDPDNQHVLVTLLLALTDQFGAEPNRLAMRARDVLGRLTNAYHREYYAGIISERIGLAQLAHRAMHAESMARDSLRAAMASFERAERVRAPGDDDAILRWNACVRTLGRLQLDTEDDAVEEPSFGE